MEAMIEKEAVTAKVPRTAMQVFELLPEGTLCEVINNVLYMSPAPTPKHQMLSTFLIVALQRAAGEGLVLAAPIDVFFDSENAYQPDLIFISGPNKHIINWEKGIMGAPDLVVEILSKGNTKARMDEKKNVYEKYGVKEYWTINESTKISRQYLLKDGRYTEKVFENGQVHFQLLDAHFNF